VSDWKRRTFMKRVGFGLPLVAPAISRTILGANDRISTALVGAGRRGSTVAGYFLESGASLNYVCDVYQPNLEKRLAETKKAGASGVTSCRDFRKILDDKNVDTLLIASPDHWHPYQTIAACKAGKDVYVEKPIAVGVDQVERMVNVARREKRVVQVGTQQRSGLHFQEAVEYVRSGKLGQVSAVHTMYYRNDYPKGIGYAADGAPPAGLDWDLWLGPARQRPFNANRFGVRDGQWSSFRWFWDYAGGMLTDWGVHLFDIVLWAMGDAKGPQSAYAAGGKFGLEDNRETPDTILATFKFPNWIATFENRLLNQATLHGERKGIIFHGTRGTLYVNRQEYRIVAEDGSEIARVPFKNPMGPDHVRDFLSCVRSRRRPVADIGVHGPSTAVCLLGNAAYRAETAVAWDPATSTSPTEAAQRYLRVPERAPWATTAS
jgi:predicted dehydrogenase